MKEVCWFFNENEALYYDQCQRALAEGRIQEVENKAIYEANEDYNAKWAYDEGTAYTRQSYDEMLKEVSGRPFTVIDERVWTRLVAEANQRQMDIVNNPNTNLPMLAERAIEPMSEEDAALQDIENAKAYLKATDMYAIKCAELGLDMRTEYPEIFERRRAYRQIVNDLERQFSIKSDAQRLAE